MAKQKPMVLVVDGKTFLYSAEGIKQAQSFVKELPRRLRQAKNRTTR